MGVARVNAYKIYVEMFDDAKRQKEKNLPPLWNHREFIHELILDLMSYGTKKRSRFSVENNDESSEGASLAAVCSTRGSSSFGSVARSGRLDDEDIDDFECESGLSDTLQKYKPASITAQRVNSNFFCCRLDGKQHPTLPSESACQYCRYQY